MITSDPSRIPKREVSQASAPERQMKKTKSKQRCLETARLFALLGVGPSVSAHCEFSSWPACPQYLLHSRLPQPFTPPITLLWSRACLWPLNCTLRDTSLDPRIQSLETRPRPPVLSLHISYCVTFSMVLSLSFCYETFKELQSSTFPSWVDVKSQLPNQILTDQDLIVSLQQDSDFPGGSIS